MISRKNDPEDRRKVLIILNKDKAMERVDRVFLQLQKGVDELHSGFTKEELRTIKGISKKASVFLKN